MIPLLSILPHTNSAPVTETVHVAPSRRTLLFSNLNVLVAIRKIMKGMHLCNETLLQQNSSVLLAS